MSGPKLVWFLANSLFSIILEEIGMAVKLYRPSANFFNLQRRIDNAKFEDLTDEDKKIVTKYFETREKGDVFTLKLIHLESSVQLTFYLTLLLFSLYEVPLLDKNYNESELNVASAKWVFGLIWLIVKTLLSGYSTFSPILRMLKKDSYRLRASAPSIMEYICKVFGMLLDLSFSTALTFLEGQYTNHHQIILIDL